MDKKEVYSLLKKWCEALLRTQVINSNDSTKNGGLFCPCCNIVHGRCFEAIYPFLYMAKTEKDDKWIKASEALFDWAEKNVSQEDGSFLNDIDAGWKGTTVFNSIALTSALRYHSNLLSRETAEKWSNRLRKAAEYLFTSDNLMRNNINYPLTNGLALNLLGDFFNEERYIEKAKEFISIFYTAISTPSGLLFGEGIPRENITAKGCKSVDIGYNIEESLPSLLIYATETNDERLYNKVHEVFRNHLSFSLPDGGWNNSFGTRLFKWTYWGSRTSDGVLEGALLLARKDPVFTSITDNCFSLLKKCTHSGLLAGGPDYADMNEDICIHHTFEHSKVLTDILNRNLLDFTYQKDDIPQLPRRRYYPEIRTWLFNIDDWQTTFTDYDWKYLPGGHAEGGTLSCCYNAKLGPIFISSMGEYTLKEPRNMQKPKTELHECLCPRIETIENSIRYSSIYENSASIKEIGDGITVEGVLKDIDYNALGASSFSLVTKTHNNEIVFQAKAEKGTLILPIITRKEDSCHINDKNLVINRHGVSIELKSNTRIYLPYNERRIFNLVPGFETLRVDIPLSNKEVIVRIRVY